MSKLLQRLDGWMNTLTGLGGEDDKGSTYNNRYSASRGELSPKELTSLYHSNWLARRIVETPTKEALKRGVEGPDEDAQRAFRAMNTERYAEGAFQRSQYLGDLYGGAGLYLGYARGSREPTKPAPPPETELAFVDVFTRWDLTVQTRYEDPNSGKFGLPEIYRVTGNHPRNGLEFHESRFLRSTGLSRTDTVRSAVHRFTRQDEPEWGLSVLQPVYEELQRYGTSWAAVAHLLQESSIGVIKMGGLIEALASEQEDVIKARTRIMSAGKSILSTLFLDADMNESYERVASSFSDIPNLLQTLRHEISGAANQPTTVLFGSSPGGMNATGESDMRQWYDTLEELQGRELHAPLETFFKGLGNTEDLSFAPLWSPTELELADVRLRELQGDRQLFDMGVATELDIGQARSEGKRPEEELDVAALETRQEEEQAASDAARAALAQQGNAFEGGAAAVGETDPGDPGAVSDDEPDPAEGGAE